MRHVAVLASLFAVATLASTRPVSARPQDKRVCLDAYESGQRLRVRHALVQSIAALRTCAQESCPAVLRRDCAGWLAEAERNLPTAVLVARAPDGQDDTAVAIFANDKRLDRGSGEALPLDPGTYRLRFEHPPFAPIERTVILSEGEKGRRIEVDFAPLAPPPATPIPDLREDRSPATRGPSPWAWVFAGAAVTSLGVGSYLLYRGNDAKKALEDCKPTCESGRVDDARMTVITADVLLGVGAVSAVTAVVLFASGRRAEQRPQARRASMHAGAAPGGLWVGAAGQF